MRPRVFPAEDPAASSLTPGPSPSFNEAAGIPRGRRSRRREGRGGCRPRFNEAAGIPRGRPKLSVRPVCANSRFNEAAGIPRGRRAPLDQVLTRHVASMRPRVFPRKTSTA